MADVVGEAGHVRAVDIDTRLAAPVAGPNLEVRQLDHDPTMSLLAPLLMRVRGRRP